MSRRKKTARKVASGGRQTPIDIAQLSIAAAPSRAGNPSAGIETGKPQDWFGPLNPTNPVAPPEVAGRQLDFPSGYNLNLNPRAYEPIGFHELRALADAYDLVRLLIETRKDQMERLTWSIKPRQQADGKKPAESKFKTQIDAIKVFFRKPDKVHNWTSWLRMLLEDLLVIDAATLWRQRARNGTLYALMPIDGATIKRVIDDYGRTPASPSPAYQQVLKGMPAVDYTADDLIYAPRNVRTSRVYGYSPVEQIVMTVNIALRKQITTLQYFCYSDDTEVMTKRGWRRFADCNRDDEFATRQIGTGVFEWQKAYDTFYKHYTGKMIQFTGRSLDMLVTPNHRMLVDSLPRGLGDWRNYRAAEHVITAEELMVYGTSKTGLPQTSVWQGTEIGPRIFVGSDARAKTIEMTGDEYCAFMGMYIAEGSRRKVGGIQIAQPKDRRGAFDAYDALLKKLFGNVYHSGRAFEVTCKALATFLDQFGLAADKFVPNDIREATPRQIEIFWRHYYLGDGTAKGDNGVATQQAITVSRKLADHLTEIGQKLGYAPSVWTRSARKAKVGDRIVNAREAYIVSFARQKSTTGWNASMVDYDAPVACVCVPNKFLYVRRNGKAVWSGNTEGNIPDALIGVPTTWNPDQISQFQTWFDSLMLGNTASRRHATFVPGGMTPTFTRDPELKSAIDEWLARVCCFCFSVSPQPFVAQMNRATAETAHDQSISEGLFPIQNWVKNLIDDVIADDFGEPDLEFAWDDDREVDADTASQIRDRDVRAGIIAINEAREDIGREPVDGGDKPMVLTAVGYVALDANEFDPDEVQPGAPDLGPDGKPLPQVDDKGNPIKQPDAKADPLKDDAQQDAPAKPDPKEAGKFAKAPFVKTAGHLAPIHNTRPAVVKAARKLARKIAPFLKAQAKDIAHQLTNHLGLAIKMSPPPADDGRINLALESLDFSSWTALIDPTEEALAEIGSDASHKALVQVGITDADITDQAHEQAQAYAEQRAAEMVGKKHDGDLLVDNPDPEWAITDATRDMLRSTVKQAVDEGWSSSRLADEVESSAAFSPERAATIARTELAYANARGAMDGYRSSGVVEKKVWLLGEEACDECQANAAAGAIGLDEDFPSGDDAPPAHPSCECDVAAITSKDDED